MEDKVNGERKKLSLSSGGKLTLKNSISANKSPNSIKANSRAGRGTVQVEVKRTKRLSNRINVNENTSQDSTSGLSAKEIQARSRKLQEGLAKTAAEAEIIACLKTRACFTFSSNSFCNILAYVNMLEARDTVLVKNIFRSSITFAVGL